jgi:hypothetical protein
LYGELYEVDAVAMSPFGHPGQHRQQRQGFENAERSTADVAVKLRLVREEERVERAAFSNPGEVRVVRHISGRQRIAFRQPPRRLVVPGTHQERVQVQLTSTHRVVLLFAAGFPRHSKRIGAGAVNLRTLATGKLKWDCVDHRVTPSQANWSRAVWSRTSWAATA